MWLAITLGSAALWFSNRYAWWRPASNWNNPRILMYHMISEHRPKGRFNGLRVPPERFEAQLSYLARTGWHFYTMSELWANWKNLPEKSVAITFDDGYADNLHNALPILEKYSAKATIYIVVDRHDRDWSTYKKKHHDTGELAREPKLTDAEILRLLDSGCIEIGSHTLTHANLGTASREKKHRELEDSRKQLEELFGTPVRSLAYPFGIFDQDDALLAMACGYDTAVTTIDGIDQHTPMPDPLRLKRIKVSGKDNFLSFIMRLRGGKRGWKK